MTMRSAAPLSIMAFPMTAASAMTMPIEPATLPKAVATRVIFVASSPGASRLMVKAATVSAMNAFIRSARMRPITTPIPTTRITKGCKSIRSIPDDPKRAVSASASPPRVRGDPGSGTPCPPPNEIQVGERSADERL